MTADELEYQLWQYADGSLPGDERAAVEARLAVDPAARAVVSEYGRLDRLLARMPAVPAVDWDAVAGGISAAVDGERPAVAGRIGFAPVLRRSAWWGGSAAAAAVALAVGLHLFHAEPAGSQPPAVVVATTTVPPRTATVTAVVEVTGPAAETAAGPAVAEVTVGPSPAVAAINGSWRYADGVGRHQPKVVLAGRVRSVGSGFVPVR